MRGGEFENVAVGYLKKRGYRILERNYRTRFGEIDIVAKKGNALVFVEVKGGEGDPRFRVDLRKIRKIELAANDFLRKRRIGFSEIRLDVIEVTPESVRHIKGVGV